MSEKMDRVLGCLFGLALGDAVGLATEFEDEESAKKIVKRDDFDLLNWGDSRTMHAQTWEEGDWTDDTDQMILIMLSYLENDFQIDPLDFARRLRDWERNGFNEEPFNDSTGHGIGFTVSSVLGHPFILTKPKLASFCIWLTLGNCDRASNGGLMRSAVLGIIDHKDIKKVIRNTKEICRVTHSDPRCIVSCVFINTLISLVLNGALEDKNGEYVLQESRKIALAELRKYRDELISDLESLPNELSELRKNCSLSDDSILKRYENYGSDIEQNIEKYKKTILEKHDEFEKDFIKHTEVKTMDDLRPFNLEKSRGFTLKTMGCGVIAFLWFLKSMDGEDEDEGEIIGEEDQEKREPKDWGFRKLIIEMTRMGGDADTNCAVAGAVYGVCCGYKGLPLKLIDQLKYREWLKEKIVKIGKKEFKEEED